MHPPSTSFSLLLGRFASHPLFERVTIAAIVANSFVLMLETYPHVLAQYGTILGRLDVLFLGYFALELIIRLVAFRLSFFRNGWNWFDFIIVVATTLPYVGVPGLGNVSGLRALRILRALRLFSMVPAFRHVLESIVRSIRMSVPLVAVFGIVLFTFSVLASKLYGAHASEQFRDFDDALLTLFQIVTLDAWSDIVRPLGEVAPSAFVFFPLFIIVTVFVLLSVLIGIATSAVQLEQGDEPGEQALTEKTGAAILEELRKLRTKDSVF